MTRRTYAPVTGPALSPADIVAQANFLTPAELLSGSAFTDPDPLIIRIRERIHELAKRGRGCVMVRWPDGVCAFLEWNYLAVHMAGCAPIDATTLYSAYCDCREQWEARHG